MHQKLQNHLMNFKTFSPLFFLNKATQILSPFFFTLRVNFCFTVTHGFIPGTNIVISVVLDFCCHLQRAHGALSIVILVGQPL